MEQFTLSIMKPCPQWSQQTEQNKHNPDKKNRCGSTFSNVFISVNSYVFNECQH